MPAWTGTPLTYTSATSVTVTHDYGTVNPYVIVKEAVTNLVLDSDVVHNTGTLTVTFGRAMSGTITLIGPGEGDGPSPIFPPADGGSPDIEAIVVAYLKAHPDVVALCSGRVGSRTPRTTDTPWVRVSQIDDDPEAKSPVVWLVDTFLQIDCYGGNNIASSQAQASLLARTCRAALVGLEAETITSAVVSKVKGHSIRRLPDVGMDPARERYQFDVTVSARPA